jgi:hypothetical protein
VISNTGELGRTETSTFLQIVIFWSGYKNLAKEMSGRPAMQVLQFASGFSTHLEEGKWTP